MRKIISLIHMTLDGMIAGENDELDWVSYDSELEQDAHSIQHLTDAVIWGRKTYEGMASYWLTVPGNPDSSQAERNHAQWLEDSTKIVVSRTLDRIDWAGAENTVLIKNNIADEINKIKAQDGKDIWFIGSPNLAQTFMELDLIDEYRININPVILGKGKSLFGGFKGNMPMILVGSKIFQSGVVGLRYAPVRG